LKFCLLLSGFLGRFPDFVHSQYPLFSSLVGYLDINLVWSFPLGCLLSFSLISLAMHTTLLFFFLFRRLFFGCFQISDPLGHLGCPFLLFWLDFGALEFLVLYCLGILFVLGDFSVYHFLLVKFGLHCFKGSLSILSWVLVFPWCTFLCLNLSALIRSVTLENLFLLIFI